MPYWEMALERELGLVHAPAISQHNARLWSQLSAFGLYTSGEGTIVRS